MNFSKLFRIDNYFRKKWYTFFNPIKFKLSGIRLGKFSSIKNMVYLHISNSSSVNIGHHFIVNSGNNLNVLCSNTNFSINVSNNAELIIGNYCGISGGAIWVTNSVRIGNHVKIGANCLILDNDMHPIDWQSRRDTCTKKNASTSIPIVINDDVWIGANSIILKGVTIGKCSIIGCGSIVTHDIPENCIAAGNPCKVIKFLNS